MEKPLIGLYLRLSEEDGREVSDESNSITSQREILKTYVRQHQELADCPTIEFCDDGYSGTNFARPGVQKLFEQVRTGGISVVMVKDFSRFGRNYIEVGTYLEGVFPFLGIRFISVNDGFDSGISDFSGEFFTVAFKNLAHDLYSKDLSEKITSVRRMKAGQGKFFTPYAPYGYRKSPGQKLIVDEEAAVGVRRIFHMALEGVPKAHIAGCLNAEGVPTPLTLRRQRGERFPCNTVNGKWVWSTASVSAILKDQRYVGDTVYGKVKRVTVGSPKERAVPREQWIIVSNTHEAIVSREVFEKVSLGIHRRGAHGPKETSPLMGTIRCGGCNRIISRAKRTWSGGRTGATYRCGMQHMTREFGCCAQTIEESSIEAAVRTMLRKAAGAVAGRELMEMAENISDRKAAEEEKRLHRYEREADRLRNRKREKYEAYKAGLLAREAFMREKSVTEGRLQVLLGEIETCRQALQAKASGAALAPDTALPAGPFVPFASLTREMVETFVSQIFICQDGSLRIVWRYKCFFAVF